MVGCTTAGEIGPLGYCTHSLSGVSFSNDGFSGVSGVLEDLGQFSISEGNEFVQSLLQRLERRAPDALASESNALLPIDGLSIREEPVAHALQDPLGNIVLFGGSAGDDMEFTRTRVFSDGQFHADSAILILFNTSLPFKQFKTQYFISTAERLVVTEADNVQRVVKEINGLPSAAE